MPPNPHIPEDDLSVFFLLSETDQQAVNRQQADHMRLGFALQLCMLRYLSFVPHDLGTAPSSAIGYVAELHVLPEVLEAYGSRIATRTTHLQQVQRHLGFRRATPLDAYALQTWLLERALEHDKPTLLLQLACDKLRREHIVRPGLTRLERFVAMARQQAHDETWHRLEPLLSTERQAFLDGLLTPEPTTGRTSHSWLRQEAVSPAAAQIIATLKKIVFFQEAGVDQWGWTSDQLSQYGSKPVIITARDATYVLDAILGNETELTILEHTTDTAGATEIIPTTSLSCA